MTGKLEKPWTAPKQAIKGQETGVGPGQEEGWAWSKGRQGDFIGRENREKTCQEMTVLNIQLHPLRLPMPP